MSDQTGPVVVVAYDDAELLDIACVTSTLAMAAEFGADPAYGVRLLTPGGHPVTTQPGLRLEAHGALERHTGPVDTLVVSGGHGHRGLARDHPAVTVDPDPIFVRDGPVATSAGVTSALDLTLSFVEEDHGPEVARRVARALVTYMQRPGTQAQMSLHVGAPAPAHDVVREVDDRRRHGGAGRAVDRAAAAVRRLLVRREVAAGRVAVPVLRRARPQGAPGVAERGGRPRRQLRRAGHHAGERGHRL